MLRVAKSINELRATLLIRWSAVRIRPGEPIKSICYSTLFIKYCAFDAYATGTFNSHFESELRLGPLSWRG
jgi:hypothetical protein